MITSAVEQVSIFRDRLKRAIEVTEVNSQGGQYTLSLLRGLLIDFESLFPKEIYDKGNPEDIGFYVEKYCFQEKDRCPICGAKVEKRYAAKNKNFFYGCTEYPKCRGTRDLDGNISLSRDLRSFLAMKAFKEAKEREEDTLGRFSDLEFE